MQGDNKSCPPLATECYNCYFKEMSFDNTEQVGCQLYSCKHGLKIDRIGLFQLAGTSVHKENGSYVIDKRLCNAFRPETVVQAWLDKGLIPLEQVKKEIQTTFDIVILTNKETKLLDINRTMSDINGQLLMPKSVRVAVFNNPNMVVGISKIMQECLPKEVSYYIDHTLLPFSDDEQTNRLATIDYSTDKCVSNYYVLFNADFRIPLNVLSCIDKELNENMNRFCLLLPYTAVRDELDGLTVNTKFHRQVGGNKLIKLEEYEDGAMTGDEIIEKAKFLAKLTNNQSMIQEVQNICPYPK